jgi:hypothetical protein
MTPPMSGMFVCECITWKCEKSQADTATNPVESELRISAQVAECCVDGLSILSDSRQAGQSRPS